MRLATYAFTEAEMVGALDRLLADSVLHERLGAASRAIQARSGVSHAADLIEELGLRTRTGR